MNLRTVRKKTYAKIRKTAIQRDIEGIQSDNDKIRAKSFSVLYPLSGSNPEKLYPYWHVFEEMLKCPSVTCKYYAIHILANLVSVDKENKFEKIYDLWFNDLLNHESPVVAPHIAEKSGKVVKAKPEIENEVTLKLLNAEKRSSCRHKELLKAYVLSAIDLYFNIISKKADAISFIKAQLNSSSPTTKNKARDMAMKYNIT